MALGRSVGTAERHPGDLYLRSDKLGEGTYGECFVVQHRITHAKYAMKLYKVLEGSGGLESAVVREVHAMRTLKHRCIVQFEDFFRFGDRFALVMELMTMSLRRYIVSRIRDRAYSPPDPELMRYQIFQIVCGVAAVHANRMMHRDIHPKNILLNDSGEVKLCDFGMCREVSLVPDVYTRGIQLVMYRAPELLLLSADAALAPYGPEIDIWSAGVVICELARGTPMFMGDSDVAMMHIILGVLGTPADPRFERFPRYPGTGLRSQLPPVVGDDLLDLLANMLQLDPAQRITSIAALRHRYFDAIDPAFKMELVEPEWGDTD